MEITEVGVRIVDRPDDRLKAVCTMTIDDCFVVRDMKVVEGPNGLFVAMPSRKRTRRCGKCSFKNEIRARFCNQCGGKIPPIERGPNERTSSHADVAHPINSECRELIQSCILEAYREEVEELREQAAAEQAARQREQREREEHEREEQRRREEREREQAREREQVAQREQAHEREPADTRSSTQPQHQTADWEGVETIEDTRTTERAGTTESADTRREVSKASVPPPPKPDKPAPPRPEPNAEDADAFGAGIL